MSIFLQWVTGIINKTPLTHWPMTQRAALYPVLHGVGASYVKMDDLSEAVVHAVVALAPVGATLGTTTMMVMKRMMLLIHWSSHHSLDMVDTMVMVVVHTTTVTEMIRTAWNFFCTGIVIFFAQS
ncbi:hypothetical protein E2562_025291 [Oryza meyeriana var. granulata]|uniref:Uncharacterized protein n=1 Tax=Oryza meyeriana var. granulata TaxID=110450 RepID=A0A6G1EP99_9ORYZ|nr:hypothetical protein E2562_025291 [Oryza meyeriana var. granulata]